VRRNGPGISDLLLPFALVPLTALVFGLQWLLDRASVRPGLLAGYRATVRAVEVVGADAVLAMLRADICLPRTIEELELAARRRPLDLVSVGRSHLAAVDERSLHALRERATSGPLAPVEGGPPPVFLEEFVRSLPPLPGTSPLDWSYEPVEREVSPFLPDLEEQLAVTLERRRPRTDYGG
jgi:hypothetical protein